MRLPTIRLAAPPGSLLLALLLLAGAATLTAAEAPLGETEFLPYGVPIPAGQEIPAPPEPYDMAKHGPPVPNTQPEANLVDDPSFILPGRPSFESDSDDSLDKGHSLDKGRSEPTEWPGSGDAGFWINAGVGVYARNDVQDDLSIPAGVTIYAPTHMPAGDSCIETVTAHWRSEEMGSTGHAHGFWDHCTLHLWKLFESMDSSWKDKYVRTFDGEEVYYTVAGRFSGGRWVGYLYNFSLGAWEQKADVGAGSSSHGNGWTMWESHHMMDEKKVCPSLPSIRAKYVQVYDNGWQYLDSSSSSSLGLGALCWANGTYAFQVHTANSFWEADTEYNVYCNGRYMADAGSFNVSTTPRTESGSVTSSQGKYYSFWADAGSTYTFSLCDDDGGAGSFGFDTWLCVLRSNRSFVTQNDDWCGLWSKVSFSPFSSGTYLIAISGYHSSSGSYTLAGWRD